MPIRRFLAAAGLGLLVPIAAAAQDPSPQQTQIQLQYHEMVPAGADTAPIFLKIFDRISKDCQLVAKAFEKKCVITQVNIYSNANYSGEMAGARMLNGTATVVLLSETASGSHSSTAAPASSPK